MKSQVARWQGLKGLVMPQKKKKTVAKRSQPMRTAKRRTALPAASVRSALKPVKMKLVVPPPEPIEPAREAIAQRAFEAWGMHVRLAHDPVQNWLEAESQLRQELNRE
jgi:hypothetical protein